MEVVRKAVFNWSGGKDSALALNKILKDPKFEVVALLTTFNDETRKSTMHSLPLKLVSEQADSIGVPLHPIYISKALNDYDQRMADAVKFFKAKDVSVFIFGDLMASALMSYREQQLNPMGIDVVEPLWDKSSEEIMDEFFKSGIQTKIIVTQEGKLDKTFIGRTLEPDVIAAFPNDIDICGEQGEYHTIAYDGPLFDTPIEIHIAEGLERTDYEFKLDDGTLQNCVYWNAKFEL